MGGGFLKGVLVVVVGVLVAEMVKPLVAKFVPTGA
jgi:hypothetical protein